MAKRTRSICSEPDCERIVNSRGLCQLHWRRANQAGTLPPPITDEMRFLKFVDVNGPTMPHMDTPCHIWTAFCNRYGYGHFGIRINHEMTRNPLAHRWGWLHFVGPIPPETPHVLHRCDNPACVRIDHLFLGTPADNMADKVAKNRQRKGVDHHMRKLTESDVLNIRARFATGEYQGALAKEFGVGQAAIGKIVRRERWTHI